MNGAPQPSLLWTVHACHACPERFGFTPAGPGLPYFKFPPTIGADGHADLLFVGINPRLHGNLAFHGRLMRDQGAFKDLERNLDQGNEYIRAGGDEPHYETHMRIVEGVYGPGTRFQEHAAVTELFFCATADTGGGFPETGSDCADEYFGDVLEKVRPAVIICIGERVLAYFQERFKATARSFEIEPRCRVLCVPHPGNERITDQGREACVNRAIAEIKQVLGLGTSS